MNTPATISPAFAPQPLPQAGFTLARNAHGRLVLGLPDGSAHEGVTPVRAFPIAAPTQGLSLVGTDGHRRAGRVHDHHAASGNHGCSEQEG